MGRKHYRDSLALDDLRDPSLVLETRTALDELTQILETGFRLPPSSAEVRHRPAEPLTQSKRAGQCPALFALSYKTCWARDRQQGEEGA